MTTKNFLPPQIEGMLDRLKSASATEKENICISLEAIAAEIGEQCRAARKSIDQARRKAAARKS
jgi:hypothetical protein